MPDGVSPLDLGKDAFQQMIQMIAGDDLRDFFQIVVGEMYIRTPSDDEFAENWMKTADSVLQMFNVDTTPVPEVLQDYVEARDELNAARERRFSSGFESDASSELKALFDKHGVVDDDEDGPGLYL